MSAYISLIVTEVSHSVTSNTSQVDISFSVTSSGATYNEMGDTSGYINLDGKRIADLTGKQFSKDTTTTLYSGRHTVAHNADGTKTISVDAGFDLNTTSYRWLYAEKKIVLTTIPRASSVAAAAFTIGTATTIRINRASSGFYHTLRYSIGSTSGAITNGKISGNTVTWTPPTSLASQLPDVVSREIDIICETYSGGKLVGTTHNKATLSVPESYRPTIQSVTLTPVNTNAWLAQQGIYVERYSKCRVQTSAVAGRGSSIGEITIAGIGMGRGADWTSGYLLGGDKTVTVTAYDRRPGRRDTASRTLSVYSYAVPAISAMEVFRCDASGKAQEDGTYLHVACAVEVTSLGGRNALTLQMRTRPSGGVWGGYTELTNAAVKVVPGFSAQKSYEVELVATDSLGEERSVAYTIPTAEVALHLRPGGKGVGIGKYSEKEALECSLPAEFTEPIRCMGGIVENVLTPLDDLNTIEGSGFYCWNDIEVLNGPPKEWGSSSRWCELTVVGDSQTAVSMATGVRMQRCKKAGAWLPWECINPPMENWVEYRTTERFQGKPVYAKLIMHSNIAIAANTRNFTFSHGITAIETVVDITGRVGKYRLPHIRDSSYTVVREVTPEHIGISLNNDAWSSGYTWYFQIKYTKTTD